jgi:hypothetical protein
MNNGRAIACVEEQVLGATTEGVDGGAWQLRINVCTDWPAQASLAYHNVVDTITDDVRFDSAAACFDFGQFRHDEILTWEAAMPATRF